jgi:hypothetical protein
VRVSETSIEVCLNISPFSSIGTTRIIISTVGGVAERTFTIDPRIVVIAQNTSIGRTDRRFDNAALTIEGPVIVTIDGTHRFNSLTLRNGATVNHSAATGASTSNLDLTVDTTLTIDATSRIDVTARGFLGGNQPGNPFGEDGMTVGFQRGSTVHSGGSYGGLGGGGAAVSGGSANPVYGDFRDPSEPGSGGATRLSRRGGNGGGLIRIVAQTLSLAGVIKVDGGNGEFDCCSGGGSAGGIRIDVETLQGTGQITANGGNGVGGGADGGAGGGGGRIAIYYQNVAGFDLSKIIAFGGAGGTGIPNGGAGTIYLQGPGRENGELVIDNNNLAVPFLSTPIPNPPAGTISLSHLRVRRAARVRMDSFLTLAGVLEVSSNSEFVSTNRTVASSVDLNNNGLITHLPSTAVASFKVDIRTDSLSIDGTSKIDVTGLGFLGGAQPGNPLSPNGMTAGFQAGSTGNSGGSYGGLGGSFLGSSNPVYGDFRDPNEPGSGGSGQIGRLGGNGGGLIRITAQILNLNGVIRANGGNAVGNCCAGGGSGGGIRIDAGTLSGTGQITATGGNGVGGGGDGGAGGGGGRVAIYYQNAAGFDLARVAAFGGSAGSGVPGGQNGSVHIEQSLVP